MRRMIVAGVLMAVAVTPAEARGPVAMPRGDGQLIRVGKLAINRPFGAELVDSMTQIGTYRVRGRRTHLIRGSTGACAARFVFVSEQPGGPVSSNAFGTCSPAVRVYPSGGSLVITMPGVNANATSGDGTIRYTFDGRSVAALDLPVAAQPACLPAPQVDPVTQAETLAAIEQGYPADFRKVGRVAKAEIAPEEMNSLVTMLACVSAWPAAQRRLPRLATPLFASRHGPAAFASLAAIAQDPASNAYRRATARRFAAEMLFRVERREPI